MQPQYKRGLQLAEQYIHGLRIRVPSALQLTMQAGSLNVAQYCKDKTECGRTADMPSSALVTYVSGSVKSRTHTHTLHQLSTAHACELGPSTLHGSSGATTWGVARPRPSTRTGHHTVWRTAELPKHIHVAVGNMS